MNAAHRQLIFENGQVFRGEGFGAAADAVAEVVFDTAMVGYQEILSDPSFCGQMVVMTYPLIGSYGLTDEDYESRAPRLSALIAREYNDQPSNYRYTRTVHDVMAEHGVPGVAGVDTRRLTRMLQREGCLKALLTDGGLPLAEGLARLRQTPVSGGLVARVSCKKPWYARTANYRYNVVAVDLGIKHSVIRRLTARGCNVTVVPYNATAQEVLALRPDGALFSNGPGGPEDVPEARELARALLGRLPLFGVCLGHLVLAMAGGARVTRITPGHHGGNHPVKDLATGKIAVTAQGHVYAVDPASLSATPFVLTHVNVLDNTAEGIAAENLRCFSVQFHPEAAPGPRDSDPLFDRFVALMESARQEANHA